MVVTVYYNGTLVICHNDSYMPDLDDSYCSAANIFLCQATGNIATAKICEKTSSLAAFHYRGELTGGVIATHVLWILNLQAITKNNLNCQVYSGKLGSQQKS